MLCDMSYLSRVIALGQSEKRWGLVANYFVAGPWPVHSTSVDEMWGLREWAARS